MFIILTFSRIVYCLRLNLTFTTQRNYLINSYQLFFSVQKFNKFFLFLFALIKSHPIVVSAATLLLLLLLCNKQSLFSPKYLEVILGQMKKKVILGQMNSDVSFLNLLLARFHWPITRRFINIILERAVKKWWSTPEWLKWSWRNEENGKDKIGEDG